MRERDWRPIETAPKDRTELLVLLRDDINHHAGRRFVALHPGVESDGFDIGWSIYPGQGGIPDEWIAGWMPLPAPPEPR
jgi:hypothetical protein